MAERAKQRAQMQKLKAPRMLSGSGSGKATSMAEKAKQRAQMQKLKAPRMLSGSGSGKGTSMAEKAKQRTQMQKLKASRMLSGSGSGKGTSMPRVPRRDGSDFPSVVLALPARNILPEMQLPPRKRTFYQLGQKVEVEEEDEAAAEGPADAAAAPERGESSNENNSVNCVVNRESSIPFPNMESLSIQENAEEPPLVKQGVEEERKSEEPKNKESKSPRGESSGSS